MRQATLSLLYFIASLSEVDQTQTFYIFSGMGAKFGLVYRNVAMTNAKVF